MGDNKEKHTSFHVAWFYITNEKLIRKIRRIPATKRPIHFIEEKPTSISYYPITLHQPFGFMEENGLYCRNPPHHYCD